jgi:sugar lactone lactonase YvrE
VREDEFLHFGRVVGGSPRKLGWIQTGLSSQRMLPPTPNSCATNATFLVRETPASAAIRSFETSGGAASFRREKTIVLAASADGDGRVWVTAS